MIGKRSIEQVGRSRFVYVDGKQYPTSDKSKITPILMFVERRGGDDRLNEYVRIQKYRVRIQKLLLYRFSRTTEIDDVS